MDVGRVAKLAQLSLSAEEQEIMTREMDGIFLWIDALKAVKGEDECMPDHPVMHERQDCAGDQAPSPDVLLANAPQQSYGMFSVPKVVETV